MAPLTEAGAVTPVPTGAAPGGFPSRGVARSTAPTAAQNPAALPKAHNSSEVSSFLLHTHYKVQPQLVALPQNFLLGPTGSLRSDGTTSNHSRAPFGT